MPGGNGGDEPLGVWVPGMAEHRLDVTLLHQHAPLHHRRAGAELPHHVQVVEWGAWLSEVYGNRQFQSTVVGVDASNMTARALLERFTSAADDNFINYQNTDYDALFQQAQATADDAEQTELYKQMERNLTEHAANVYIQDLADLVVLRNGLEGYQFYPIYVMDLSTVHYAQ